MSKKISKKIYHQNMKNVRDTKKGIFAWALYDWANSAFATTVMAAFFPIFFRAYWGAGNESTLNTFYLGLANSVSSIVVAFLSPVLGAIADNGGYRKKFLIFFAFLGAVMSGSLFFVQSGMWPIAVFFYILANIGFACGNTFYDSMLPSVASEKKVDLASSVGYSMGYIGGGVLFLVNVLMFLMPERFGLSDGVAAVKLSFLMVGIWWLVFSLPIFLFVPSGDKEGGLKLGSAIRSGFGDIAKTLKSIRKLKNLSLFLIAYWCYIDGVDTIIKMATDYGTSLGFPADSLIVALLITQFVAFPAAILYSFLGHRIGVKNAILFAVFSYSVIAVVGFFMTKVIHFYILAICIGLFQGGIQALSRSYFSRLVPEDHESQFFGFFNMLGKFASIIGPFLVGIVSLIASEQRYGIISLVILFIVGFIFLRKVDEEEARKERDAFSAS